MSTKIYVGNLSYEMGEETITSMFEAFGEVTSCKVISDRETGRSKGFAFVEMADSADASSAISGLNGTDQGGRALRVNEARPRESAPSRNRW